jgi:hypothetical protein
MQAAGFLFSGGKTSFASYESDDIDATASAIRHNPAATAIVDFIKLFFLITRFC